MTTGGTGPWELDFSSAQMNQTVLPGEDVEFWLVVYAISATELFTLGTIRLTLQYDNISQVTPAPPEPALSFSFGQIAVAGQSPIVADSAGDTLTIAAGSGIALTTTPGTDTLTIAAIGGTGSGDVAGPASATDNAISRFDGTTGKIIQNSLATIDDAGLLTVPDAVVTNTLTAAHIHGNLAGAVYTHVRNESGGPLTKGTPVYISGYNNGLARPLVAAANAASLSTLPAIGILDADLANNASGHCVISGVIENLNTAGYTVGTPLYVASGGGLTATAPVLRAQSVAIVERVNSNTGSIIVTEVTIAGSLSNQSAASVAITGGTITGITDLAIADGGTGASTAADARTNLGLGTLATQSGTFSGISSGNNSGDVTLSGQNYLSLAGQVLTVGQINLASHVTGTLPIANGGTGSTTAANALTALGAYAASNPAGYTSNTGTVTNVTGTAPISVSNGTTTPAIGVDTFGTSNSGVVPSSGGGTTNFLRADGQWAAPPGGGGGGAPTDADYLVRTANASLSAERVVGDSTTVTANWATGGAVSFERAALTGDVTASANSNSTTIAAGVVTYAKIQNVSATDRILGRSSAGAGVVEEITCTASGRALLDDASAGAQVTTLTTVSGRTDLNANFSLSSSDQGAVLVTTATSAINVTVPSGLPAGFSCIVIQGNTGQLTFVASGTTVNSYNTLTKTAGRYASATLVQTASNSFILAGNLA
jgi:hypothetical protein